MSEQTWEAPPEGSLCWIEIPARNAEKVRDFYIALFPSWKFKEEQSEQDDGTVVYQYTFERPERLGGGIVQMPKDCPEHSQSMGAGYTNYYMVDDVDEAVARVEKLGGKLVLPKRPQGKSGMFANVVDVEGNRFGLYQWLGNNPA
ncbi:uncharacterized protein PV09_05736 [Verruconis gallopava]|uniref:VOC domain-containing protein n=1 Tax=Verruconis gallopava TaxID=253628 RepID=A0A0D1XL48_9PEZI|nr:uncharacterized protein PV09_05736 [Verruconis gallopava]KIW03091.1 hypothetical protein PV09_05736 [Verruconis gallopava]